MKNLKYYDVAVTFAEFPDEVTLCVNISNCPGTCDNCSEPWLRGDVGTELTNSEIDKLIEEHPDITVFGLMGGDNNHSDCVRVANYIHTNYPELKVGMYSGRDWLDVELLDALDLYKIGRFIMPKGDSSEWWKTNCGVLQFPFSNQLLFERVKLDDRFIWKNVTYKFRQTPLGDLTRYIIMPEDNKD